MAPTTRASSRWATSRVTALPEFWNLVAEHSGLVGAWRLTGVCRASRVGAKEWLRTLRRLVVCGGYVTGEGHTSAVWRLDLGELRWEQMSDLGCARAELACCTVRGNVVVLGGLNSEEAALATVEVLRSIDSEAEEPAFTRLYGSSPAGMRSPHQLHRTPHRQERERRGAGAPARRMWRRWTAARCRLKGAQGGSGDGNVHSASASS
jgi:hypothetical protein